MWEKAYIFFLDVESSSEIKIQTHFKNQKVCNFVRYGTIKTALISGNIALSLEICFKKGKRHREDT